MIFFNNLLYLLDLESSLDSMFSPGVNLSFWSEYNFAT